MDVSVSSQRFTGNQIAKVRQMRPQDFLDCEVMLYFLSGC